MMQDDSEMMSIRELPNGRLEWTLSFIIPKFAGYRLPSGHTEWRFHQTGVVAMGDPYSLEAYQGAIFAMKRQMEKWLVIVARVREG